MKGGFTLIELLVVLAITAIVSAASFIYLGGYRSEQNLKLTGSELLAASKNAQDLSKSQEGGKKWGMRFTNATSGQSYQIWSGSSYATSAVSRTGFLGRNIQFGNPPAEKYLDISFGAITGYAQNQVISLITGKGDNLVNDITVNSFGQVSSRFDTGLVGYWHFDENSSTTAYDASGNGINNILTSGPTWQTGSNCKAGSCIGFDGTNDYLSINDSSKFDATNFTIMAWVYETSAGDWQRIFDFNDSSTIPSGASNGKYMSLVVHSTRTPGAEYFISTGGYNNEQRIQGVKPISLNTWVNLAVTVNGGVGKLYVNGAQDGVNNSMSLDLADFNFNNHWLGRSSYSVDPYFSGRIDEARVYNRALSAAEIADIYNSTR